MTLTFDACLSRRAFNVTGFWSALWNFYSSAGSSLQYDTVGGINGKPYLTEITGNSLPGMYSVVTKTLHHGMQWKWSGNITSNHGPQIYTTNVYGVWSPTTNPFESKQLSLYILPNFANNTIDFKLELQYTYAGAGQAREGKTTTTILYELSIPYTNDWITTVFEVGENHLKFYMNGACIYYRVGSNYGHKLIVYPSTFKLTNGLNYNSLSYQGFNLNNAWAGDDTVYTLAESFLISPQDDFYANTGNFTKYGGTTLPVLFEAFDSKYVQKNDSGGGLSKIIINDTYREDHRMNFPTNFLNLSDAGYTKTIFKFIHRGGATATISGTSYYLSMGITMDNQTQAQDNNIYLSPNTNDTIIPEHFGVVETNTITDIIDVNEGINIALQTW